MKNIINKMTLKEKIEFCTGKDFWHTKEIKELGIKEITMSDGPHGLRYQENAQDIVGINESTPATCFPSAVSSGSSWDKELYAKEAKAIALEALQKGVDVVLGPACNIKRNPLCGRNFEYLSEDPYHTGEMASAYIFSMEKYVSTSIKHFALNNQEYKRQMSDSQIDERALREIYLRGFEKAIKNAKPSTLMCSYNKINGVYSSDNKKLLKDILRNEWGYEGLVVTDWGAMNDRVKAFEAGCDLNMPGNSSYMEKDVIEAVKNKKLDESYIDKSVERILNLSSKQRNKDIEVNYDEHDNLACDIAKESAVLLKNENDILPLKKEELIIVGYMAKNIRYQGGGSSHINPTKITNLTDVLNDVPYYVCDDVNGNIDEEELSKIKNNIDKDKKIVIVAGLPESFECEALDRENIKMPEGHNRMIEEITSINPNTIVVLFGGSAMELPWANKVKGILYMGLPGQAGGKAIAQLLLGKTNPSGKLCETWPKTYEDVISKDTFGKRNVEYRESIYVGYRYYDKANKEVLFPFGYGLSYTKFKYSNLKINNNIVSIDITNIGNNKGKEIVELYVGLKESKVYRPIKELKGFEKIELNPGETKRVNFKLDDDSFAIYQDRWVIEKGRYEISVGSSSKDIRCVDYLDVDGEDLSNLNTQKNSWYETLNGEISKDEWLKIMDYIPQEDKETKKGNFTMNNSCMEMKDHSLVMKIQYKVTEAIMAKSFNGKKDYQDPAFRMMMVSATDSPMRTVVLSSGGLMSENIAKGLVEMANGHYIKGLCLMLKK